MRRFAPLFLILASVCATAVQAALDYVQYSIKDSSITPVEAPADGIAAWTLNTADTILFVRDTTKTDAPYYIAVFELTHAQAASLKWANASSTSNDAFGLFESAGSHPLNLPLAYPTAAQWKAYVAPTPEHPCNVWNGIDDDPRPVTDWRTEYIETGLTVRNPYGLYDTYGNVAECTLESVTATPVFYGWYAGSVGKFANLNADTTAALAYLQSPESGKLSSVAGVRPIYLPPEEQTYSVTLYLDGQRYSEQTDLAPGATVTIEPPTPEAGYVLADTVTIQPETLEVRDAYTFTMPTENVTFAFTTKAQATLVVEGGTANPQTICAGDSFTLTADPTRTFIAWEGEGITDNNRTTNPLTLTLETIEPGAIFTYTATFKPVITIQVTDGSATPNRVDDGDSFTLTATGAPWQQFDHWEGEYKITEDNKTTNPLTLTCSGLETGTTLSYTAVFTAQPRVMVFGGTAEPDVPTADLGEGYYAAKTRLTLTPHTTLPPGYTFSHWLREDGSTIKDEDYVYTVREGDAVTFTAVYQPDETQTNTETLHIGAVSETNLTARTAIGYVAATPTDTAYDGNAIRYYGATEASSDYARLDFATKTINLADTTKETANSEANRSTSLVLKRVKPTSGATYYVGIHEVTCAQYEAIVNEKTVTNLSPHVTTYSTRTDGATFLEALSNTFNETFTKPTYEQIENISTGAPNNTQEYGDKKITNAMVNSSEDNVGLLPSGTVDADPYGFYDLWGNAAESFVGDDANLWGGSFRHALNRCNLKIAEPYRNWPNLEGAIRAAITVPERLKVTVANLNQSFSVLPNQPLTLKNQCAPGRRFLGWTVQTASSTETYTTMPATITITEDTTLTATFSEPLTALTLSYDAHCIGPETALPGTTISIYAVTPERPIKGLTVTPAEAATIDLEAGTITFSETATGTLQIQTVAPTSAPGFQFRLR